MSNTSTSSHKSGDSRRRRSRGGRSRSHSHGSGSHSNRSERSEEYRPQGPRPPRNAPVVQLSWWQKLLQAIGLYKAPVSTKPAPAPARTSSSQPTAKTSSSQPTAKTNTRNARTSDSGSPKSKPARTDTKPRGGDGSTVESPRVYVGNLSYDVNEHDLEELFKGIGGVRSVEIVYNRSTHRSKGYGFVEMLHKDEAVRAVEVLHDQPFMGRQMIVSGAKSKGADSREDREDRDERPERAVVVAPVPAAAIAEEVESEEAKPA